LCVDKASIPFPIIVLSSLRTLGDVDVWFLVVNNLFASKSADVRIACNQNFMSIYSSKIDFGFSSEVVINTPSKRAVQMLMSIAAYFLFITEKQYQLSFA